MRRTIIIITLILSACVISARHQEVKPVEGIVYLSEFASLQDAITAVPNGGTIIVPRGIWTGDAVIPEGKYVHIQGASPAVLGQAPPLGSTQWDYLLTNYPNTFLNGSILRGKINATARASKISVTNIIMIGHGSGVAIDIGSSAYMSTVAPLENVSIGNYDIGVRAIKAYQLSINKMQLAGIGTALIIKDGNLNRLRDVDITTCGKAADIKGEVVWHGGSVQACGDGITFYQTAGYLGAIHFEQIAGTALFWDGYGGKLDPNFYASNSGALVLSGYNNVMDIGWVNLAQFDARSKYNIVTLYGLYTDLGWQNRITNMQNIGTMSTQYADTHKGQGYYPDGIIIKGADGKNYRLTVVNGVLGILEVK